MRPNDILGPHLNAYCANRGKEYGVDWMFVYRYQTSAFQRPEHETQITLTWDMTPTEVKVSDSPSVAMRHMDTIYVVQAKAPTTDVKREMGKDAAVQSPGPQVSHRVVDITNGETRYYQEPDVTRQWIQAVHQDNMDLRASVTQLKQELSAKKKQNKELGTYVVELTKMSKDYREMVQRRDKGSQSVIPNVQVAHPFLLPPSADRMAHQHPQSLSPVQQHAPRKQVNKAAENYRKRAALEAALEAVQEASQQNPGTVPSTFVEKCEAVRDPSEQASQQLQPLQFPSFESGTTVPDSEINCAFDGQSQAQGRFCEGDDMAVMEGGVDAVESGVDAMGE